MTADEFSGVPRLISNIWGVQFDESKTKTWFLILGKLDLKRLYLSLQELATASDCKYHPKPREIVKTYEDIRRRQHLADIENKIARQALQTSRQQDCPICGNSGDYYHRVGSYDMYLRCLCPRGRDLNKWREQQITKGMLVTDPATRKAADLYVPDMRDALSEEEIEIIKAKCVSEKCDGEAYDQAETQRKVKKLLEGMAV